VYIQSRFTKDGSDWINKMSLFNRGLLITYNLWDSLSWKKDQFTLYEIQKRNKRFIRRLEKKCNVHQRQGLERFVVIETDKPRNHCHLIMETPIHLSKDMMLNNIHESLDKTKGLGKVDIRNVRYKQGMIDYLCKELRPNKDSIDWENSYFKGRD
jgi:hypothetical protein